MKDAFLGVARTAAEVLFLGSRIGPCSDLTESWSSVAARLKYYSARIQGLKIAHQMDLPLVLSKFSGQG